MKIATGVDHLLYGWVFFGLVMFILFWVGSFWREDIEDAPDTEGPADDRDQATASVSPGFAVLTALVAAGIWPVLFAILINTPKASIDNPLVAPEPGPGWQSTAEPLWDWRPEYQPPDRSSIQFYNAGNRVVALYMFQFLQQEQGAELVRGLNLFVEDAETWRIMSRGRESISLGGDSITVDQVNLSGAGKRLFIWSWYRIGDHYTANRYEAKIWELIEQLSFSDRGSAHIVLATDDTGGDDGPKILQAFISEHLEGMEAALDNGLREPSP